MSSHNSTPISGVSQRASDIAHENRETQKNVSDADCNLVEAKIPRSLIDKIRKLTDFMGLSANILLCTSIHLVLSYAKEKDLEIKEIQGYPSDQDFKNVSCYKLELTDRDFQYLETQQLLEEVSQCAILGLEFLYLRLIEMNRVG
jgi:hypothetical protein